MTGGRGFDDDATGQRLRLLIGLVVVAGSIAVAKAAWTAATAPVAIPSAFILIGLVFAVTAANRMMIRVRVRDSRQGFSWTEVAILLGLAVAPPPWVILCTAVGITASKLLARIPAQRAVFGVAKETLVAAVAAQVFVAVHGAQAPVPTIDLLATASAFAAMAVLDEILLVPVIALATRTSVRRTLLRNWDFRLFAVLARVLITGLAIGLLSLDADIDLLLAVPAVMLCVHLWHASRVHGRQERQSWQKLAQTTDELNVVQLDAVLRTAVQRAPQLFSADEAEVELHGSASRLVRGGRRTITYDGPAGTASPPAGSLIETTLEGHEGTEAVGVLRLRFRRPVKLTQSEQYKLQTFASALCTAIRNATAYAELERIARENAHAARHDALTGLANRRALLDRGGELAADRKSDGMTALLLIDLNHFKEVNDTLGHSAGDQVLTEVAHRLAAAARPGDLVARLGGDEFAILLTGLAAPAVASHRAEALLSALEGTIEIDGMRLTVEACGGIALAPGTSSVTELLRRADVAMYQAKRSGQRTATYLPARDTADVGRLLLGGDLSRAVAEHQFQLDFQPIVDLATGEVMAVEALARWHHPEHGNLNPRRFLQTVERSGQLPAFADAVLDQALTALHRWRGAGFDVPVAVNVSPRSLLDPGFARSVLNRLASADVAADRLVLELTETLTMSQLEVVERALAQLRDGGVRLALDDFGTGACSLSVLSRIPVDQLKIDREVIRGLGATTEASPVVRSAVDLARSLHLTVVAEGVESEPQRRTLWDLGCLAGQGHLFARPMSGDRLLAALRRGCDGRPGTFAPALHDAGAVIRMPHARRSGGRGRSSLPHLPA